MSCGRLSPRFNGPDYVNDFSNYLAYVSTLHNSKDCCQGPLADEVQRLKMCEPDYLVSQIKDNPENASAVIQLANYCNNIREGKTVTTDQFQVKDACNVLMYTNPELLSRADFSPCDKNMTFANQGFLQSGIPPSRVDVNTCTVKSCDWLSEAERGKSNCPNVVDKMVSFDGYINPKEYAEKICSNSFSGSNCVQVFTEALTNMQNSSRGCCTSKIPLGKSLAIQITIVVVALVLIGIFIWLIVVLFRKISTSSKPQRTVVTVAK